MRKILIANRGEIACRIIRTAKAQGIATVAVYSEADCTSMHVENANEAVAIGPSPAARSYLDQARILAAAHATGADAVHPGYGFLSENADFAEAVMASGLTWIGPSPETIRLMGDKQTARQTALAAGVPVVPGSQRFGPGSLDGLADAARKVGYPLLVKAAAGGGGIGMQRADLPDNLENQVVSVQAAALKAFGNGDVYLERYVPKARHVEVQVFGLGDGQAIHLHERDCSLQRRFQKVIEETPAPGLPDKVRQAMTEAALSLCRAVSYSGLGTIEFIVDAETLAFYFLEMNTRIQVEHPVTEMVTGIDLVRLQLDLCRKRLDALPQQAPLSEGNAIECRIYAENPAKMFFPSPGSLRIFRLPSPRPGLRIDTGYRECDAVTPFYDPMIAKVVAHAKTRQDAIALAQNAIREFQIEGIATNRNFLLACLADQHFKAGQVTTRFIDDHKEALLRVTAGFDAVPA